MSQVIQTDGVFDAFLGNLNGRAQAQFLLAAVQAIENKMGSLDTNQTTALTTFQATTNTNLSQIRADVTEALRKADILEQFELGQIEEALRSFMSTSGIAAIIEDAVVQVQGEKYRLGDLIEAIAGADAEAQIEFVLSANSEDITQVRYTLTDGTAIVMAITSADDATTGHRTYTASTADWKGTAAAFELEFKPVTKDQTIAGTTVQNQFWQPVRKTNLTFSFTDGLTVVTELTGADVEVDLNSDGQQGNP